MCHNETPGEQAIREQLLIQSHRIDVLEKLVESHAMVIDDLLFRLGEMRMELVRHDAAQSRIRVQVLKMSVDILGRLCAPTSEERFFPRL